MKYCGNSAFLAGRREGIGHYLRAVTALGVVLMILTPIAAWQFGAVGVGLVVAFAVVLAVTQLIAHRIEESFTRAGHLVAGLLAASGVRMAIPLFITVLALTVCARFVPPSGVLLLIPLYLSVLWIDVVNHVRQSAKRAGGTAARESISTTGEQG